LTLADADNRLNYAHGDAYSIVEMLRAAGVETWWLSNQNRFGIWDNYVSALVEAADHVEFVSERGAINRTTLLDAKLLAPIRRALEVPGDAKVIFVHFKGTHWPITAATREGSRISAMISDRPRSGGSRFQRRLRRISTTTTMPSAMGTMFSTG
jgi:glucan phosphoethanolaminetransferase (alkaline phosphatase superfamily)